MPYHVTKSAQCPVSKPWGVVKDSDGSVGGRCHATKTDAEKQMAALYAKEPGMKSADAPKDNLVRAFVDAEAIHLRDDSNDGDGRTLFGHFAVFNRWTEIHSFWEGDFFERIMPGAFARTFDERREKIKVLYDHGKDPQLGNKPLGPIRELREDKTGAYYEVDLIDTSYNDDFVIPALRAGLLGASFRFSVVREEWNEPRQATKHNPGKLPERSIFDTDVYEFGAVTFPAYEEATAGVRCGTDDFLNQLHDPAFVARFTERAGLAVVEKLLEALPPTARDNEGDAEPPTANGDAPSIPPDDSADGQPSLSDRERRMKIARLAYVTREGVGKRFR